MKPIRLAVALANSLAFPALLAACGDIKVEARPDAGQTEDTPTTDTPGSPDTSAPKTCTFGTDADCDDGDTCTVDVCNVEGTCTHTPLTNGCLIGGQCWEAGAPLPGSVCSVCLPDVSKTEWSVIDCDDDNPCTKDTCSVTDGCLHLADDAAACDDGRGCSADDHCAAGVCVGTCACEVDADCTEEAGACRRMACEAGFCTNVPDPATNGLACDDGLTCTEGETCAAGLCGGGDPMDCSASGDGVCLAGVCDEDADGCVAAPVVDGTTCDDADACTEGDACAAGACVGAAKDCSSLSGACTTGSCVEGSCAAVPKAGEACDDGNVCTLNDACSEGGACAGTWDEVGCGCNDDAACQALADACNMGVCDTATGACSKQPLVGTTCDDGNACTSGDTCDAAGSCTGAGYTCEALSCQSAACDGLGGCSVSLLAGFCLIDGACYADQQSRPGNPCQICDVAKSTSGWSNVGDGTACSDANGCTVGDTCQAGACKPGAAPNCADALSCTTDTCKSTGAATYTCQNVPNSGFCAISGTCVASGAVHSGQCASCQPAVNAYGWTNLANGTGCNADSNGCTQNDACSSGTCVKGAAPSCSDGKSCTDDKCNSTGANTYSCTNPANGVGCHISGVCYKAGQYKSGTTCYYCDVWTPTSWTYDDACDFQCPPKIPDCMEP